MHASLPNQISLTKHKSKEKIIKNFKMLTSAFLGTGSRGVAHVWCTYEAIPEFSEHSSNSYSYCLLILPKNGLTKSSERVVKSN